ncbi:ATP-dependent Clp protease proteolytic subunit [Mariniflexile gromovii]|uniref:ATP-dependent Clp protease proteolytic subunit n=1 Tax=Mariniflexile gromovii TaxID=362523 RepID=A0ABS4BW87_9FLAO|nr:Clp protease ClpP [Mariniflexile gromovii]MBP0904854.1 Clp protease ClpP [Mariniflexile gromovii]
MKGTIYINGVIENDSFTDVIRQVKGYKGLTELEVIIDSVGGSVEAGQSIFNYLRNLNIQITTVAKQAYSIAASIFMAGDIRLVEEGADRVMIHFPWASVQGGSDDLVMVAKELKQIENDFIKFYSSYTSIDENSIAQLLKNETFLSADEAVEMGFATAKKSSIKAVAYYHNNEEENKNEMTKTQKFINAMEAIFGIDSDVNGEENTIVALVIQDANGEEINFTELSEDEQPKVRTEEEAGSKAVDADNKPIEGERVQTDGSTWVFEAGELVEIKPVEEEVEETIEEEVEASAEATEEVEEEIDFEALLKMLETSITAKFTKENDALKSEIKALKKLVGSEEATVIAQLHNSNNTNNNKASNYLRG